jgi:transglutaminase-like putative cysteine protease
VGRGEDCEAQAERFVALARASGLSARLASGVVYLDGASPGFRPHAWAAVDVDADTWFPVDPTLGQVVADATHIELCAPREDCARSVLRRLDDLSIDVIEIR